MKVVVKEMKEGSSITKLDMRRGVKEILELKFDFFFNGIPLLTGLHDGTTFSSAAPTCYGLKSQSLKPDV